MPAPLIGVLALQGDVRNHREMLASLGAETRAVRTTEQLEGIDGLVIPGGESTTMSHLLVTSGLLEPLRARLAGGLPAFGTCAGMILLARRVLDGRPDQQQLDAIDIEVRRNAFGRQIDSFETDLEVTGLDRQVHAIFIRAPLVVGVAPGVEVLATVETANGQEPVVCRQGTVLVSSFHPELTGETRLHQHFLDILNTTAEHKKEPV